MADPAIKPAAQDAKPQPHRRLIERFADRYYIDPDKLLTILKATAFKQRNQREPTNEEMAGLLIVADQYGLNPFTREIFAFLDKSGGIVPVVGVDGWSRVINGNEFFDGFSFTYSDEIVTPDDAKPCPAWCEVTFYRTDRSHPMPVREYLDEVYRAPYVRDNGDKILGPWQTHTKRFLRHKAWIQGARLAFGLVGIYDEDEAERIIEGQSMRVVESGAQRGGVSGLKAAMAASRPALEDKPGEHLETVIAPEGVPVGAVGDAGSATAVKDAPTDDEARALLRREWVEGLDSQRDLVALSNYADSAPESVRLHPDFGKGVKRRIDALKGKE